MSMFTASVRDTDGDDVIVTVNGEDGTVEVETYYRDDDCQIFDSFTPAQARRLSHFLSMAASIAERPE